MIENSIVNFFHSILPEPSRKIIEETAETEWTWTFDLYQRLLRNWSIANRRTASQAKAHRYGRRKTRE